MSAFQYKGIFVLLLLLLFIIFLYKLSSRIFLVRYFPATFEQEHFRILSRRLANIL